MSGRRKLAAPFQGKPEGAQQTAAHQDHVEVVDGFVNFRNFTFPPLESLRQLKFNKYCGPTPESNWVIPGVLLVGAYPASEDDDDTFDLITSILKHGITKFVCLQSEYQAGVSREVWQAGGALRPYFEDVESIVSQKDTIPELDGCSIVDIKRLSFDHCPIIDCGVTDDSKVLALAQKLTKDISEGEVIYLHCWGGHGRTGTVVCIMLYLLYGMNPKQAFDYCQAVHDLRTCPVEVGSPQTQTQRQQVVRVINLLMHEYEVRKARHHEEASVRRQHAQKQLEAEQALALKAASNPSACCGEPTESTNNTAPAPHVASPPMKPNLVVRDTTQEHIFAMEKHNHGMHITGGSASLAYNPKLGRKVHNTHAHSSAQNGHSTNGATASGAPPKSAPLLPVIQSKNTSSFVPASPAPVTKSTTSAIAAEGYDGTHSLSSTPSKTPPPTGLALSESGAMGLLQSLQAHPPRNPPPHNSRTEVLHKLHSRGASATASSASAGELPSHEVYVPRSSDEGESTNDEDESGFLVISNTPGTRIPLHTGTSRMLDQMHIQVSDLECTSPMDVSPSVLSAASGMGYISSSTASAVSRPSTVQDSPMAGGDHMDLVVENESSTPNGMTLPAAIITSSNDTTRAPGHSLQLPMVETEESNLDDPAVRPASVADSPASRSQSTESTPKARRLSGKSITNVFKAGIKIFTGGSTPRKKETTGPEAIPPSSSADNTATGDQLKPSLKTASTESTCYSSSSGYSPPPSNATTPTTQHLYQHTQHQQHNHHHHSGTVDPTPPKGAAPTARPHHTAHPAHTK